MGTGRGRKRAYAIFVLGAIIAIALPAQTITTQFRFDGTDGAYPNGLIQAANGDLYGTTFGGAYPGAIFKITPNGTGGTLSSNVLFRLVNQQQEGEERF